MNEETIEAARQEIEKENSKSSNSVSYTYTPKKDNLQVQSPVIAFKKSPQVQQKSIGGKVVTGIAESVENLAGVYVDNKGKVRKLKGEPKASDTIAFIFPQPTTRPKIIDDELEQIRQAVNIPKRPEPIKPLVINSDLAVANSFEIHMSTKRNHSDLSHNPNDLADEDIYGGLDIL